MREDGTKSGLIHNQALRALFLHVPHERFRGYRMQKETAAALRPPSKMNPPNCELVVPKRTGCIRSGRKGGGVWAEI